MSALEAIDMTPLCEVLSEFGHSARISKPALDVLRLSLLDWAGVALAGRNEPVSEILRAQALEEGGSAQASMIGSSVRVPARVAALVNGSTSHALDYDDTHFVHIGHPSVAVIPAALAMAQRCKASGTALQEAALIGVEASIRVGLWLGRSHYQAGFHQTATAGAFGACLAACRLLGLDHGQTIMALGVVSTRASGLKSQFGTMGKPMNAGIAAANGVEAALLAVRGFVSRGEAFDGPQGFGATHHGEGNQCAWERLGEVWKFEEVSHKFHACCHGLHATLEALTPFIGMPADEIDRIEITTHPRWLTVCNIDEPTSGLEAKFSYRMVTAMRILGRDTSLPESFADDLCRDTRVAALRDKVSVKGLKTLSETQARVVVHGVNGIEDEVTHDLNARRPYSEREARLLSKAAALMGGEKADRLWALIRQDASPDSLAGELLE